MSADLRDLLERTAAAPTAPVDPVRIATRSRRRTRRWRGGAGATAVALVTLLAVVAWPGGVPGDLIIDDRAADRPEVPVLDLPDGWVQVQVGDATFGIPGELEIVEVDADDPPPCRNAGNRAHLATESYPVATRDAAGRRYVCSLEGNTAPVILAAPLSAVPAAHLGSDEQWHPRRVGSLDGAWRLGKVAPPLGEAGEAGADDDLADRTAWYRVPAVDLYLRFVTTEADVDLVEAILATVTPIGDAGPDGSQDAGETPSLDLPEGWQQVEVGDATFGVPTDLDTFELAPNDGPPCHNGLDRVRTYLAPDGYPRGVVQDRDPGGLPTPDVAGTCRYPLAPYTSVLAAPLSTVPELVREQRHAPHLEPAPRPTALTLPSGIHGQRIRVGGYLEAYAFPQVDLWLEFHNVEQDPELAEQVLATVTAVERR